MVLGTVLPVSPDMPRRIPLSLKLGAAFTLVIALAVALVYGLTAWSVTGRFDEYRQKQSDEYAQNISTLLAWYRQEFGTWVGAYRILYHTVTVRIGDQVYEGLSPSFRMSFSLANEDGHIFISTEEGYIGRDLTPEELERGVPIVVDGARVGTLLPHSPSGTLDPQEATFLGSAKRSALIGGGIAVILGLAFSVLLISRILSPLRVLTGATERIAHGDFPEKVRMRSRDEFGQLGTSFNHMIDNLRRSETLRQTMTADIAHELRTPVTIIQGTLEAVLDGVYEPSAETIAPIYEETLHLGRLIDDLRDLALAEAGELRLETEPVDLGQLVKQVAEAAAASREDAPQILVDLAEDLPPIAVDSKRFRQIMANLLSNALRYTPEDGTIRVVVDRVGREVEVSVTDTGPGISSLDLPHLFERFYRGDPARNRTGGSGLGLAIVRHWVEAHGGRIWAENQQSGGARFTLRLPLNEGPR